MMPNSNDLNLPESETWDHVIADAGLAGVIAAGELALKDHAVLIVEPRTALGCECTRAKCPVGPLLTQSEAGAFLGLVTKIAREMARRPEDLANPFLLEIALEKAFVEAGGKILYGATPCGSPSENADSVLTLEVATKSGKISCTASRDILWTSLREGSRTAVVHGLLIIGAKNSEVLNGVFPFRGLHLNYRVPPADEFGRTQIAISWEAAGFDLWEAEKVLNQSVMPIIQKLRSDHKALKEAEIVYFWDEPVGFVDGAYLADFHWVRAHSPNRVGSLRELNKTPLDQIETLALRLGRWGVDLAKEASAVRIARR
jgi:hypothetical protein